MLHSHPDSGQDPLFAERWRSWSESRGPEKESVTSLGSMERKKPTMNFTFSRPQDSKHPSGFTPWQWHEVHNFKSA